MASVIRKRVNGRTYYYLAESARVGGQPRIVSQRYLGTADDLAALAAAGGPQQPTRTRHVPFGDVAAVWGVLGDLDLVRLVDRVVGAQRSTVSVGTYLALAVLHQIVAPEDGTDLAGWWPSTAAPRFVRPRLHAAALERRRFWRAMQRLDPPCRQRLEAAIFEQLGALLGPLEAHPVLVLDIPMFATYAGVDPAVDTGPRPAGLGLVVTLDGAIPLVSLPYRLRRDRANGDDRPGGSSFAGVVDRLIARHRALAGPDTDQITVVVDAGWTAGLDVASRPGRHFIASLPPGDHLDLVAGTAAGRRAVDRDRFPGVTALDTRASVDSVERRVLVVYSQHARAEQERGLAQDLATTTRRLDELADALSRGTRRWQREQVTAEIARITRFRFVNRVLSTTLTGIDPGDLRLRWTLDEAARTRLRNELFGKQLLVTDHDDWQIADVLTGYRARYRVESTLRQCGAGLVAAPSTAWQWNNHRIAIHALICVLATTVTHLMRRTAQQHGLDLSSRDLLDRLAGIEETQLRYPSTGGRPRIRRRIADSDATAHRLYDVFRLDRYAPPR